MNRQTRAVLLSLAALAATTIVVVVSVFVVNFVQERRHVDDAAAQARAVLLECTTPGPPGGPTHTCYEDNLRRTAEVVGDLRKSTDCVALYVLEAAGIRDKNGRPYKPGPDCAGPVERTENLRAP